MGPDVGELFLFDANSPHRDFGTRLKIHFSFLRAENVSIFSV